MVASRNLGATGIGYHWFLRGRLHVSPQGVFSKKQERVSDAGAPCDNLVQLQVSSRSSSGPAPGTHGDREESTDEDG